jgi:hypothetical protein
LQVIRQLAALCIQAHQQTAVPASILTAFALYSLLRVAEEAIGTSATSRLAASVRQQLQGSGLLQRMPAMLVDAADGLAAAAAAVEAATLSSSSTGGSANAQHAAQMMAQALSTVEELLDLYTAACAALSPDGSYSLAAALPAAPAAVRLALTTFQTCSRLQQQQAGMDGTPAFSDLMTHQKNPGHFAKSLATAHWTMLQLSGAVVEQCERGSAGALQSLPGARELLLCPELVPCLAVTVLVTFLSFDTGGDMQPGAEGSCEVAAGSVASSSSGSSNSSSSSSSSGRGTGDGKDRQGPKAKPSTQQAAGSKAASAANSSSSSSSSSSSTGRLANGISLNSLTPLSRGLFGLLRVDQGVLLQAAKTVSNTINTTRGKLSCAAAYTSVMEYEVSVAGLGFVGGKVVGQSIKEVL